MKEKSGFGVGSVQKSGPKGRPPSLLEVNQRVRVRVGHLVPARWGGSRTTVCAACGSGFRVLLVDPLWNLERMRWEYTPLCAKHRQRAMDFGAAK